MACRYAQEIAPLLSSGICRSRPFGTSQRSLAAFAQAFAEEPPVWKVFEPRVEQLYHRSGRRPAFVYPRSGWIAQAFRELDDHLTGFRTNVESAATQARSSLKMAVDVEEDNNAITFVADVPGLEQEHLKVHLTKHKVLTISGERSSESSKISEDGFKRVERRLGSIVRRFQLPDNVNIQNIEAKLQNGVLTLTVPKTELGDQEIKIRAAAEEPSQATSKLESKAARGSAEGSLRGLAGLPVDDGVGMTDSASPTTDATEKPLQPSLSTAA